MRTILQYSLTITLALAIFGSHQIQSQTKTTSADASKKPATVSKLDTLTKGMTKVEGLWTVYHNDQKLLVNLKSSQLNKNYIILTSIARGVSSGMVLGGMSWGFGDDILWSFRKVGEKIHVLRKNVRFKAKSGSPEADAVKLAYSDSVLYSLPILTSTSGGSLVDMSRIFMSDDQGIGKSLGGFRFATDRSTWAKVKAYPKNVELQVAAVYTGSRSLVTVADSRGVQVNVHYSISELPSNGYKPRAADDRVGYFMTVHKDFSNKDDDEHFTRNINRWNLQKADPTAKLSPPKEPIIFYLEKTIPIRLRPYIRAGIEEWNKAFEKIGFSNAIEVRQQRTDDDWDPEDIRYNTFRWITAEAGFAMGPSRVNPLTGQILDADIIFDASFLRYWKHDYETFTEDDVAQLITGRPSRKSLPFTQQDLHSHTPGNQCQYCRGMQHEMSFSAAILMAQGKATDSGNPPDEFIHQGLKEVVMHEVGHTLGLRHNFKASTWKPLAGIDDPIKGASEGTVASVMDYSPANIVPKGTKQGLYFSQTIGPYDYWAIEYGYKAITGSEKTELNKIAARCTEPGLDYATDEDTRSSDSDPLTNRFDLGKDPMNFVERRMKLSSGLLPTVLERSVKKGQGYQRARQAFGMLFSEYWRSAFFVCRFPGGVYVHRDHKGDKNERAPFKVVEPEKQRRAMKILAATAFASPTYDPNLLNHLAATRWSHWGMRSYSRLDYPIHEFVGMMQGQILAQVLDPTTLARMQDNELKISADADAYTLAEHIKTVVDTIFSEWSIPEKPGQYTARKPFISSFRRNLQRTTLKRLATLITSSRSGPEDARTLSRMHLTELRGRIQTVLAKQDLKLDDYSKAHLLDSSERIKAILEAKVELRSID